jgi:hypothetical protein
MARKSDCGGPTNAFNYGGGLSNQFSILLNKDDSVILNEIDSTQYLLCAKTMKITATFLILFASGLVNADPITCTVKSNGDVYISMIAPHPEHALVYRPNGETVWLQTSPDFIHKQIENFGALEKWVITPETKGTVWVDGKASVQPIIQGNGRYQLYIAENPETEPENSYFIQCYFVIEK